MGRQQWIQAIVLLAALLVAVALIIVSKSTIASMGLWKLLAAESINIEPVPGLKFKLDGPWIPSDLRETLYSFTTLRPRDRPWGHVQSAGLAIVRYKTDKPQIREILLQEQPRRVGLGVKVGKITYNETTRVTLAGLTALEMVGVDANGTYMRIDIPDRQVAIEFVTDRDVTYAWLRAAVSRWLPDLRYPPELSPIPGRQQAPSSPTPPAPSQPSQTPAV